MRRRGEYIVDKRLKFKTGLQREFLGQIKNKSGLSWSKLALHYNLSLVTLKGDMYSEKSTLPYSLAKEMISQYPFEDFNKIKSEWVNEILDKHWGQKKAGSRYLKKISTPSRSEAFAELLGIILGDGHVNKKGLRIVGHTFEKLHHEYTSKIIKELFGLKPRLYPDYNKSNATVLNVYSKEISRILNENGLKSGDKIKECSSFPSWVYEDKTFIFAALRGLFDTDGGIYLKQKKYSRAFIEFQTHSDTIRWNIHKLLNLTGFSFSKSTFNVRIQDQQQVKTFLQKVGSSNPKNIVRAKTFLREGFIPLKDNLINEILNYSGELPFRLQP